MSSRRAARATARNWENGLGRAVSRILSRPLRAGERHLSRQPIPGTRTACAVPDTGRIRVPYWALLPGRFSLPRRLRAGRWALTPPFHPYRQPCGRRRFVFCGTVCHGRLSPSVPAGMPAYPLTEASSATGFRGPAPYGVRTFLPQPAPRATLRPSKTAAKLRTTDGRRSPNFTGGPKGTGCSVMAGAGQARSQRVYPLSGARAIRPP